MKSLKKIIHALKNPRILFAMLFAFLTISCAFTISVTLGIYVDHYVKANNTAYVDDKDGQLKFYLLTSGNNEVGVVWNRDAEGEDIGPYQIPMHVYTDYGEATQTEYTVKAILESGFRYTNFSSITFEVDGSGNGTVEEIQREAFYSCQNLTNFSFPQKCVRGIAPSTFMDCRRLQNVDMTATNKYIDEVLRPDTANYPDYIENNHFDIGDHAFSSCVELISFSFPSSLRIIGESAFHNCKKIIGLFLPDQDECAKIRIEKYAFSDCTNMTYIYFTTNVVFVDSYAFTRGNNRLKIYYGGEEKLVLNQETGEYDGTGTPASNDPMASYFYVNGTDGAETVFRRKNTDTDSLGVYPIRFGVDTLKSDDVNHPGFLYMIETGPIKYEGYNPSTPVDKNIDNAKTKYVTIFQFQTPPGGQSADYTSETRNGVKGGRVTIPATIENLPVKKIADEAFYDRDGVNDPLYGVTFQNGLVQIGRNAFKGCNKLDTINFSGVKGLNA